MYNKKMIFGISNALQSIRPNSEWVLRGDEYSDLEWLDENQNKPSEKEINNEINKLQSDWDYYDYSRNRKVEYPDFTEYLDGVVKGDQDQINNYIAKCILIKEKYPKPE